MIIESIAIENFQSHVNTVLEPAPAGQLTVIVGPSDSGKTAIIRALRWNYYDVPRGTGFINVKANASRVTVTSAGGAQVTRERNRKGYNRYVVDGQKYEGFGSEIPAEVLEATGVRPVCIGDLKLNLNLSEQLDGPFLGKSVSALAKAKVLGKLAGTEEVDYAAKQLGTDLYRRKLDKKTLVAGIENLEKHIGEYDYLPVLAQKIADLEKIVAEIKASKELGQKLTELREKLVRVKTGKAETGVIMERWKYVGLAERSLATAVKATAKFETLSSAQGKLAEARAGVKANANIVRRWSGLTEVQVLALKASEAGIRWQQLTKIKNHLAAVRIKTMDTQFIIKRWRGLETAKEICTAAVKASSRRVLLERRLKLLSLVRATIGENKKTARQLAGLDEAGTMLEKAAEVGRRIAMLTSLNGMLLQTQGAKKDVEAVLHRTTQIKKIKGLVEKADALAFKRGNIVILADSFSQTKTGVMRFREAMVLWEQKVSELESAYRDELVLLGRCPLCGGDIDIQRLKEVV